MAKTTTKTKRVYRKRAAKGKRMYRKRVTRQVQERASIREIYSANTLLQTNQMYQSYKIQLANCPRAVNVAKSYQYFRIKKVHFKFSPLFDTFQNGASGGNTSIPHLYCMIDRTKNLFQSNSVEDLRKLGAKPRRLDDKMLQFSFAPSVLNAAFDGHPPAGQTTTQFVQYKVSPWLNTRDNETIGVWNPDSTDHLGMVWIAENSGGNNIPYKMEIEVEYEFKKPSFTVIPVAELPAPIDITEDAPV